MKKSFNIGTSGPTHMELIVDFEAPYLRKSEAIRRFEKLGNPILDVKGDKITSVHQIEKIIYDNSEADQGELVWMCDGCHAYSKSKAIIDEHEKACDILKKGK